MGKGDKRRPCSVGREELAINWLLFEGKIDLATWKRKKAKLMKEGKITRDGRVVK